MAVAMGGAMIWTIYQLVRIPYMLMRLVGMVLRVFGLLGGLLFLALAVAAVVVIGAAS